MLGALCQDLTVTEGSGQTRSITEDHQWGNRGHGRGRGLGRLTHVHITQGRVLYKPRGLTQISTPILFFLFLFFFADFFI